MNNPAPKGEALEDLWRQRLHEAQRRYMTARAICANAAQECAIGLTPSADGHFALQRALRVETVALQEYKHTLTMFADLILRRKMPEG